MESLFEYTRNINTSVEAFQMECRDGILPIQSHWHYFMELIFVKRGRLKALCEQNTYILSEGDVLICYPRAIHSFDKVEQTDEGPLYYVLKFDLHFLRATNNYLPKLANIFTNMSLIHEIPIHITAEQMKGMVIEERFATCIRESQQKAYGFDLSIHSQLCLLLVDLIRMLQSFGYCVSDAITEEEDNPLGSILEYMDLHASEPLTVQELAKRCNMSYSYFSRSFKKYYGRSCKEYLEFIRVCKAENLLLFTSKELNYISSETGFADCSHFIKTFKRYKNITPKQYRLKDLNTSHKNA